MIKRMLPLLIGLSVCGGALAQNMPASAQSTTTSHNTSTVTTWAPQPPTGGSTEEYTARMLEAMVTKSETVLPTGGRGGRGNPNPPPAPGPRPWRTPTPSPR